MPGSAVAIAAFALLFVFPPIFIYVDTTVLFENDMESQKRTGRGGFSPAKSGGGRTVGGAVAVKGGKRKAGDKKGTAAAVADGGGGGEEEDDWATLSYK